MPFSNPGVIIDCGSFCCKAGFACDNHPVSIIRTLVGRPKNLQGTYGKIPYEVYIGDEAVSMVDYELYSPVVRGKIVDWDNIERIWHHVFYRELRVAPEERAVMLACAPKTTMEEKIKCCEIFFETLNVPAFSMQSQSVLSLYGSGYTTGLSVDLGYDITEINPVYEGGPLSYAEQETYLSGREITEHITNLFLKRGICLNENYPNFIEDLKRSLLRVAPRTAESCNRLMYPLPSGELINVSQEVYTSAEMLFSPQTILGENTKCIPLHEAVLQSVNKCDSDLRNDLFGAVVPSGGLSVIPGLTQRLANELEQSTDNPVNVIESSEAHCLAWLGAAVFSGLDDAEKIWIHKKQFDEYGDKIVRKKLY